MNTNQEIFQQAQLSEAAYANFIDPQTNAAFNTTKGITDALQDAGNDMSFSVAQATAFVAEWKVVHQLPDTGSGFSATVFQNKATGEYSFALRGTTLGPADIFADAGDVLADGIALDQVVDMYNYWQSLKYAGSYQAVKLNTLTAETIALNAAYLVGPPGAGLLLEATLRARPDVIIDSPSHTVRTIQSVNSSQLTEPRLQTGSGILAGATAVNVDGHSLGGHLAMAFSRLFPSVTNNVVAVNGAGFGLGNTNVDHLFAMLSGDAGFDASKITNVVGSAAMNLVSQDWLLLQQPAGRTEIYTESYSLDNSLGHGSSQMTDSLALYDILAKIDPALNTTDPAVGIDKITGFLKAASNQAPETLERTVNALVDFFGLNFVLLKGALIDNREELYTRVASLQTKVDAVVSNASLTLDDLTGMVATDLANIARGSEALAYRYALKALNPFAIVGNNDLYAVHNASGELNLYKPEDGSGTLTTRWLEDRAKFLTTKIGINTNDQLFAVDSAASKNTWYQDLASGESAYVFNSTGLDRGDVAAIEASLKKTEAERVFFDGDDGNPGLTGAYEQKGDDPKTFGNAEFTLTWNGKLNDAGSPEGTGWLTIAKDADPSGTIRILGFDSTTAFLGIDINGVPSTQVFTDLSGTNANDTLTADASFQKVYGLDGNDRITVSTAGAVAYGGTGSDYVTNGVGDQKLYGEAGNDILVASDGNDELYGGLDNDALQGGADDDYLEGNEGNDVLDGGAGGDVLAGGAGSDVCVPWVHNRLQSKYWRGSSGERRRECRFLRRIRVRRAGFDPVRFSGVRGSLFKLGGGHLKSEGGSLFK